MSVRAHIVYLPSIGLEIWENVNFELLVISARHEETWLGPGASRRLKQMLLRIPEHFRMEPGT